MTTPHIQFAFVIKIDFKLKVSPYTVTSRYFSVSNYEENELYSGQNYKCYGLLRQISGLGSSAESEIPTDRTGTITLDNTRGSVGHNLRFSDWLDKEEIVAQPITVYYLRLDADDKGGAPDTSLQTEFVGKILPWEIDPQDNTITLSVVTKYLDISYPQHQISLDNATLATSRSIGQYLPIIFGSAIVPSYLTDYGDLYSTFSYATYAVNSYSMTSSNHIDEVWTKDADGDWCEVIGAASTSTKVFNKDLDGNQAASASVLTQIQQYYPDNPLCVQIDHSASTTYIITSGFMYFYDDGSSSPDGQFNFYLIQGDANGKPFTTLAEGYRDKADYSWDQDDDQVKIEFVFNKPVVLHPDKTYFLGWSQSNVTASSVNNPVEDNTQNMTYWVNIQGGWKQVLPATGVYNDCYYALLAYQFDDQPTDPRTFRVLQQSYASLTEPSANDMSFIIKTSAGINDDSLGTTTGISYGDIVSAASCIKALISNTTVDIATFDCLNITNTVYPRRIDGASRGRMSIVDMVRNICKASASKLVARRNGNLAVWCYGHAQAASLIISEKDCILKSIKSDAVETVVNKAQFTYAETAIPLNAEDIQTGQPRNFESVIDWDHTTGAPQAAWSTDSYNIYGERPFSATYAQFPWLRDDTSAEFLAKYAMTVRRQPRKTVELEVPFLGKGYDSTELMDLVTLIDIDMPNEYGTSAEGVTPYPVEDGVVSTNVNEGDIWHEAKAYTCRIVSRKVNFKIDSPDAPTIDFKLEVLDNPMEIR